MNVFQFFIICKRTNNANNDTHYVKLDKKRRESSKRNYYVISPRVIIRATIIIILTIPNQINDTARRSRYNMNGTISQLHKGGSTNKPSDQRPVVLLNSGYQLLNYIINELFNWIVEQVNVFELGQGGSSQSRNVNINMPKMHFVMHEAHRQGKQVY